MSLTKFNENVNNVSSLPDKPTLTSEELKAVFDRAGNQIKSYLNDILTGEVDTIIAQQRQQLVNLINTAKSDLNTTIIEKLQLSHPIGSTYITQENVNPSTILGFGTWERLKGKVCVGLDEDDEDGYFDEIGKTGGSKTHKHLMPFIVDNVTNWYKFQWNQSSQLNGYESASSPNSNNINNAPSGDRFNGYRLYSGNASSLQPYEVVGYMWIRRL